jgi:hypothetical protein
MEKDDSGNSTGKDPELDALLSAADTGMLDAIRDNLDLDTGFAQILGDLTGATPTDQPTGPAEAELGGQAHSHGHVPDPILACEVPAELARARPRSARKPAMNRAITIRR